MKQQILFVCHCFFNDASKLKHQDSEKQNLERQKKRLLLKNFLDNDIELIQLPCPEFIIYGSNRWGHVSTQFDTPFFRKTCEELLQPYLLQIEEYYKYPDQFEIIGIIGINGSPSCGVQFTCGGDWGGEFSTIPNLNDMIHDVPKVMQPGIFMDVFQNLLASKNIILPFYSLEIPPKI
jgi:predicted secreted protein